MAKSKLPVKTTEKGIYYPSLDGLRFFAFFLVFLHHSFIGLSSNNIVANFFLITIQKNGWVGVDLFFVLSGFLITSLLLKERQLYGKFSLKNFWIRRSLRIWPLYYLALLMGFFVIPYLFTIFGDNPVSTQNIYQRQAQLPLYLSFLGNWAVVTSSYSSFSNISHLWTISLEEQFYFLWPLVLLLITNFRRAILAGGFIILLSLVLRLYLGLQLTQHPAVYVNTLARIDTLTLGALLALVLFYRPRLIKRLSFLAHPGLTISSLIIFFLLLHRISVFDPSILRNLVFGYLIIGLFMVYYVFTALNSTRVFNKILTLPQLVWLGKISYGLYVWHILALELSNRLLKDSNQIFIAVNGFLLTALLGGLSYYLFEIKFLKLKSAFTKVKSRPS